MLAENLREWKEEWIEQGKAEGLAAGRIEGKAEGLAEGRIEGLAEGRIKGKAEGRIEGLAEGRIEGLAEGRIKGKAEGRIEGLAKGRIEGREEVILAQKTTLLDMLSDRFGYVPASWRDIIFRLQDSAAINQLTRAILKVETLEDYEALIIEKNSLQ